MPDGFPPEMRVYHRFAKAYGWAPEQVRGLRRAELFWLPVIDEAEGAAVERIQAMNDK
jgi:hypothetical protein